MSRFCCVGRNLGDHLEFIVGYECRKPVSCYPATKLRNRVSSSRLVDMADTLDLT